MTAAASAVGAAVKAAQPARTERHGSRPAMPTHPAIAPSVTAPAPATRCRPPRSRGAAWQSGPAGVGGADLESGTRRASRLGHGASRLGQPCGPSCTPPLPWGGGCGSARPGPARALVSPCFTRALHSSAQPAQERWRAGVRARARAHKRKADKGACTRAKRWRARARGKGGPGQPLLEWEGGAFVMKISDVVEAAESGGCRAEDSDRLGGEDSDEPVSSSS
jgi:hypothetical protein